MACVLVIDDNDDFRSLLRLALEREGFVVQSAPNGQEGLVVLQGWPADVLVTDIFMPGKEGIETISEVRRQFPQVRIVAMSGRPSATDFDPLSIAAELGAAKTLKKPFDLDELIDAVRRLAPGP
jgi:two-component system, chemotaxis family, chemotaxis protein CheY